MDIVTIPWMCALPVCWKGDKPGEVYAQLSYNNNNRSALIGYLRQDSKFRSTSLSVAGYKLKRTMHASHLGHIGQQAHMWLQIQAIFSGAGYSHGVASVSYYIAKMPNQLSEHRSYKCARKKNAVF